MSSMVTILPFFLLIDTCQLASQLDIELLLSACALSMVDARSKDMLVQGQGHGRYGNSTKFIYWQWCNSDLIPSKATSTSKEEKQDSIKKLYVNVPIQAFYLNCGKQHKPQKENQTRQKLILSQIQISREWTVNK